MIGASCVQPVGEPITAQDAPLGERLAPGRHLSVHVAALPHPVRGAAAGECCGLILITADTGALFILYHYQRHLL